MQQGSASRSLGSLVAEWCGAHVLVRCEGEDPAERAFLAHLPSAANELFLSASRGACADPELLMALPGLLRPLLRATAAAPHALWLGVSGLAGRGEELTSLAVEMELDVVAPDGAVSGESGTSVHAGRVSGGTGWYLFRPGSRPWLFSTRYPIPAWERWVPIQPVANQQLLVDPVPAGLLVRDPRSSWAEVRRAAARVPVSGKVPKVLLAGAPLPAPDEVAKLLQALPEFVRASVVLIPVAAAAAKHEWLVELSTRLGRPVVFSTGAEFTDGPRRQPVAAVLDASGNEVRRPFASALRQPSNGGEQQVVGIAEPPPGWQRCGQRTYRPEQGPKVFAEVVPSGLALRDEQGAPTVVSLAAAGAFDPAGWSLHLVPSGGKLSGAVLAGVADLLGGIDDNRLRTAAIRVWGPLDRGPADDLHALAEAVGVPVSVNGRPPEGQPVAPARERPAAPAALEPLAAPVPPAAPIPPVWVPPVGVPPVAGAEPAATGTAPAGSEAPSPEPAAAQAPAEQPPAQQLPAEQPPVEQPADAALPERPAEEAPAEQAERPAEDVAPEDPADWARPATPIAAPIATVSAAPVPTMSGMPQRSTFDEPVLDVPRAEPAPAGPPPAPVDPPSAPADPAAADDPAAPASPDAPVPPAPAEADQRPDVQAGPAPEPPAPSEVDAEPPAVEDGPDQPRPDPEPVDEPEVAEPEDAEETDAEDPEEAPGPKPDIPASARLSARDLRDRPSTGGEQTRFTTAAGPSFSDALATVNAAMASWPALRQDDSVGAKADFVAVCLYLGRGEGGAEVVNEAIRGGVQPELDGHLPCLVSGIRRLPTHRRPVLRQGVLKDSAEETSTPGTLFVEPGFLSASMNLDVTVPGALVDVLIWPHRARRTSELALNRPMDEVVFLAGTRFKTLAVRDLNEQEDEDEERDEDAVAPPKMAVLFRELAPDERATSTELDDRDLAALSKLDRALARRQRGTLRVLEDADAMTRLTSSMVETDLATAGAPQEERRDSLITTGGQVGHP
ncbi:hypothetical protein ACL03H_21350 [Saccharopolyspora sp. MS10]|uniref:hypothetical protein n=1 Tax=Saccharopolyspora sp. MS10 TaxID=3385973 RepID=UPI0039A001E6